MKVIFIRHGEANYTTDKLTCKGRKQIKWSYDYIKDEKPLAIYCSPTARTLQTANILNKKFKVPMHIMSEITERQYLKNKERDLYWDEFDKHYLDYNYKNDHFETCKDFIDRCHNGFRKILSKSKENSTVIICAHSSTFYALTSYINGIPESGKISWVQCSNGAVLKFYL